MTAPRLYQQRPGEWFLDTCQPYADEIPVPSWLVDMMATRQSLGEDGALDDLARALSGLYGIGRRMGFADGHEKAQANMREALGI